MHTDGFEVIAPALLDAGSTDNCGITTFMVSQDTVTCADLGTVSIVLSGTDASGNTGSCTATVNVVDTTGAAVPSVDLGPDTTLCSGTIVLDAGAGFDTYLWSTSSGTQTESVTTSGTYSVTVTTAFGCEGSDDVTVNAGTLPVVNLGADTTLCGGPLDLDAGNPGASYLWSTSAGTQVISVAASGTYGVTVTNPGLGCESSDDIVVTINSIPAVSFDYPDDTVCFELGIVTLTGETPAGGTWSGAGVSGNTFDPTVAGVGAHTLTYTYTDSLTGCSATDTDDVYVDICIGVTPAQPGLDISLYPNPNTGIFYLSMEGLTGENVTVDIWSADGKKVWTDARTAVSGEYLSHIDLSQVSKGVYMVKVVAGERVHTLRVVTQ